MRKITPVAILTVVLVICGLAVLGFLKRDENLGGIDIPSGAAITLSVHASEEMRAIDLSEKDSEALRAKFRRMPGKHKGMYDTPSHTIIVRHEDESDPQEISIWLGERFVYEGHYLGAWTERMVGDDSRGYRLERDLANLIERASKR